MDFFKSVLQSSPTGSKICNGNVPSLGSLEKIIHKTTVWILQLSFFFFFLNKLLSWKYLHCTCQKISHLKSKENRKESNISCKYKTVGSVQSDSEPSCNVFFPSDPQSSSDSSRSSTTSSPPSASFIRAEDDIG